MTENKKTLLYINKYLDLDELNRVLNKSKYQEIEVLYIQELAIDVKDLRNINFPITLKHIFMCLHIDNFIFMDNIYTNKKLGEYLSTDFFDMWKIPFDCNLTFRISQNVWNMEMDENKILTSEQKYCEWVISYNKIHYCSVDTFNELGMYLKATEILFDLYKHITIETLIKDKGYNLISSSYVKPV